MTPWRSCRFRFSFWVCAGCALLCLGFWILGVFGFLGVWCGDAITFTVEGRQTIIGIGFAECTFDSPRTSFWLTGTIDLSSPKWRVYRWEQIVIFCELIWVAAAFVVLGSLAWWFGRRTRNATQCRNCGYDLRGASGNVCSECGAEHRRVGPRRSTVDK